jgi:hypothetical protein
LKLLIAILLCRYFDLITGAKLRSVVAAQVFSGLNLGYGMFFRRKAGAKVERKNIFASFYEIDVNSQKIFTPAENNNRLRW